MIPLTLAEIAEATGGRLHNADGTELVTGTVEFDSRRVGPGGLFVALPGEKVDGHDFARAAREAGAVGVLAARPVDAPAVIVPAVPVTGRSRVYALAADTDGSGAAVLAGFAKLAGAVARRLAEGGLVTVGVTGSAGKTSTKDLIAALLTTRGPTVAPPGSFNNEIGHPWTVLRADEHTRYLVLELSARGVGHVAGLCAIAPPRIGAVLNVGTQHLQEFRTRETIAVAKGELVEALPADGVAVLNADDPLVAAMAERTDARVLTFGTGQHADVRAVDVTLDEVARPRFRLHTEDGEAPVALRLHGAHQVANALAAAAVALAAGLPLAEVAAGLSAAAAVSGKRMEVTTTPDGVTVINDAYNASPEATKAALRALVTISGSHRSWAVLGPLAELGEAHHARVHEEIGRLAADLDVGRLVVVGEAARPMYDGASRAGTNGKESVLVPDVVPDVAAAVALLRAELRAGDVVLVKAANAQRLWRVADALMGADA
jgi:UDP-N-acetylmuramoyl-tripeptide--D-alanyl-D-alanine ligase